MPGSSNERHLSRQPFRAVMLALLIQVVNFVYSESFVLEPKEATSEGQRDLGGCRDKAHDCPLRQASGYHCVNHTVMREMCQATCKFCDPEPCEDHESTEHCKANILYCFIYPEIMKYRCAETCGYCNHGIWSVREPVNTVNRSSCIDAEGYVYCKQVKKYCITLPALMKVQCQKTCDMCRDGSEGDYKKAETRILGAINESSDPCDDFYEYACGGWLQQRKEEHSSMFEDNFAAFNNSIYAKLRHILEQPDYDGEEYGIQKLKTFYTSCMDTKELFKRGATPLKKLIESKFLKRFKLPLITRLNFCLTFLAKQVFKLNIEALFSLSIRKDSDRKYITISPPPFVMQPVSLYLDKTSHAHASRVAYKRRISKTFSLLGVRKNTDRLAEEILNFEIMLAEMSTSPHWGGKVESTLHSFNESFKDILNWTTFFRDTFGMDDVEEVIHDNQTIIVESTRYLEEVQRLLQTRIFMKRTIARYMIWRVLATLSPLLSEDFRNIVRDYEEVVEERKNQKPRSHTCVEETNRYAGQALGKLYVQASFGSLELYQFHNIVESLLKAFKKVLNESDWLCWQLKESSKSKIGQLISKINHRFGKQKPSYPQTVVLPDHLFKNVINGREEMFKNKLHGEFTEFFAQGSYVFYDSQENNLTIPAGIIQAPLYDYDAPKSVNFGSLGAHIVHELSRLIDESDYDSNMKQCLLKQYDEFHPGGQRSVSDLLKDEAALAISFRGYRDHIDVDLNTDRLPGPKFTHSQLFFLSYAQMHCDKRSEPGFSKSDISKRFRVNGPLQNSQAFNEAFQCKPGSYMNKTDKCKLW